MKFCPGRGRVKKRNRKKDKKQHRLIKKLKITVICTFKLKERKTFLREHLHERRLRHWRRAKTRRAHAQVALLKVPQGHTRFCRLQRGEIR